MKIKRAKIREGGENCIKEEVFGGKRVIFKE